MLYFILWVEPDRLIIKDSSLDEVNEIKNREYQAQKVQQIEQLRNLNDQLLGAKKEIINTKDKSISIEYKGFKIFAIWSKGDYVCFFDADDYIENNKVTKLKANFNNKLSEKTLSFLDNNKINYELKNNSNIFSSPVFLLNFIIVMMIFSISFLNIIALFSFWKIRMKNTFMAYHICGCGNKEKIMIISGTLILIILISSFIALGLFLISFPKLVNFKIISDLPSVNYIYIFQIWVLKNILNILNIQYH